MPDQPFATHQDVSTAWRPLTPIEQQRADYLLGFASWRIRRRWPDVDDRLAAGTLQEQDLKHVVVGLVLQALPTAPQPGARSWQVSSGSESRSITLGAASGEPNAMEYYGWMLDILDPAGASHSALPEGSSPPPEPWPDPAVPRRVRL